MTNGRNLAFAKIVLTRWRQNSRRGEKQDMTDSNNGRKRKNVHNEWEAEGFFFFTTERSLCMSHLQRRLWARDECRRESHHKQPALQSYTAEKIQGPIGGAIEWIWWPSGTYRNPMALLGTNSASFFCHFWVKLSSCSLHVEKTQDETT